ncbi:hypothetical protein CL617_05685, partial [archaeon]|nr:hypothetical protein [archaeon]
MSEKLSRRNFLETFGFASLGSLISLYLTNCGGKKNPTGPGNGNGNGNGNGTPQNKIPIYNQISEVSLDEETEREVELLSSNSNGQGFFDEDGDNLSFSVLSNSILEKPVSYNNITGITTSINGSKLNITGNQDFYGKVRVNLRASDGKATVNGSLDVLVDNLEDNPNVIIDGDLIGSIEEEHSLDGSNSISPDG